MSKYTTEIRYICEQKAGLTESVGYANVESVLEKSWDKIFDFNFPIFDETYRKTLCKKILKHFYTREIGAETYGLFHLYLDTKMNEIMPYFNKLYKTETLEFNPLYNFSLEKTGSNKGNKEESKNENKNRTKNVNENGGRDISVGSEENKTYNGNVTENNVTTSNSTSTIDTASNTTKTNNNVIDVSDNFTDLRLKSDTPQGTLSGVSDENYLSEAEKNTRDNAKLETDTLNETVAQSDTGGASYNGKDTSESTTTTVNTEKNTNESTTGETHNNIIKETDGEVNGFSASANSTDEYAELVSGFSGISGSKLVQEYRDTLLNIDMMIIIELEELFLQLW